MKHISEIANWDYSIFDLAVWGKKRPKKELASNLIGSIKDFESDMNVILTDKDEERIVTAIRNHIYNAENNCEGKLKYFSEFALNLCFYTNFEDLLNLYWKHRDNDNSLWEIDNFLNKSLKDFFPKYEY